MHSSGAPGTYFELVFGPHSSSSERLKSLCMFGRLSSPTTRAGTVWGLIYTAGNKINLFPAV
eukprot:1044436-Alexandrium_andersonii.AAC.1